MIKPAVSCALAMASCMLLACSPTPRPGGDAGSDAASDAMESMDAGPDGGSDAATDAGSDAGMACQPTCAHHVCGTDDGCGSTCAFPSGGAAGSDSVCLQYGRYLANYGDPTFAGVCASISDRNSTSCSAGAARFCQAKGFATGFPVQTGQTEMTVMCVATPAIEFGNIADSVLTAGANSQCSTSDFYSANCMAASDNYCTNAGYVGGYGPIEIGDTAVSVACLPASVADGDSVTVNPTFPTFFSDMGVGQTLNAAADDWCLSNTDNNGVTYAGGFGPVNGVSNSPPTVKVLCIRSE